MHAAQVAGGAATSTGLLDGGIIAVLVFLFLHHVKNLPGSYKIGLIVGNLAFLGLSLLSSFEVLTAFFTLFVINLLAFAVIGIIQGRGEKRLSELEEQLVDALLILSGSLKAGRSLEQGFDLVQKSLPPPISQEFFLVLQNQSLGMPFERSLRQMLERVPSKDFRLFVTATLFQRETGGNIISLYDQIIAAVADRKKMRGKVESMSVQGRYSAYIIATLPVALFAVMAVMNPEYVSVFWQVSWAKSLFVLAIVLEVTGIIVIKGILNRKVG
jgi:tight adherence protein B